MIRLAVLIQYMRVTDGRTDRQTDGDGIGVAYTYTHYSIYAVTRKKSSPINFGINFIRLISQ